MQIKLTQEELNKAVEEYLEKRIKNFSQAEIILKHNNAKKLFWAEVDVKYGTQPIIYAAEPFSNVGNLLDSTEYTDDHASDSIIEKEFNPDDTGEEEYPHDKEIF